jgi:two-component system response regulator CpxR
MLRSGIPVKITAIEFNILDKLMRNAGKLVTRDELATDFLGHPLSPYDRSIDVHISRLRKKLGSQNGGTQRIKSIRGAGYVYLSPMLKVSSDYFFSSLS